jgi:hypothetical protein
MFHSETNGSSCLVCVIAASEAAGFAFPRPAMYQIVPSLESLESRLLMSSTLPAELLSTAQPIDLAPVDNATIDGTLDSAGLSDLYALTPSASGRFTLDLTSGQMDSVIRVYNSNGRLIASNNNASRLTTDSHLNLKLKAGLTYYIKVSADHASSGDYALNLTSTATDDYGNTTDTSKLLKIKSAGTGLLRGTINYSTDSDVLELVATKTGVMQISTTARDRSNKLNSSMVILNSDGVQIADSAGAAGQTSTTISFDAQAGQTYYVVITGYDGSVGRYVLRAITTAAQQQKPATDITPVDPNLQLVPGLSITAQMTTTSTGLQLVILGTDQADVITLSASGTTITLVTQAGSSDYQGNFTAIYVYGFGGDDTITLTNTVATPSTIYGGSGNDTIYDACQAGDNILGQDGDDMIVSVGGGADHITGGAGTDSVWMDSADTLTDSSSAETAAKSVHSIASFYQPYSTSSANSNYVSLEIAGQDLLDPTITSYASTYANFASQPLFVGSPQYNDIRQGSVGDCYLVASLASLAQSDPTVLEQMITSLGDGTYAVRFFRDGQAVYVRIDADLPVNSSGDLVYAALTADSELWVALVEKAYAYFRTGGNSYSSLDSGWMGTVYQEITNISSVSRGTSGQSADLVSYITEELNAGHALTAGSKSTASGPIVGSHAYMIQSIETTDSGTFITVYNPWGCDGKSYDSNSSDGLLRLSLATFQSQFSALAECLA